MADKINNTDGYTLQELFQEAEEGARYYRFCCLRGSKHYHLKLETQTSLRSIDRFKFSEGSCYALEPDELHQVTIIGETLTLVGTGAPLDNKSLVYRSSRTLISDNAPPEKPSREMIYEILETACKRLAAYNQFWEG